MGVAESGLSRPLCSPSTLYSPVSRTPASPRPVHAGAYQAGGAARHGRGDRDGVLAQLRGAVHLLQAPEFDGAQPGACGKHRAGLFRFLVRPRHPWSLRWPSSTRRPLPRCQAKPKLHGTSGGLKGSEEPLGTGLRLAHIPEGGRVTLSSCQPSGPGLPGQGHWTREQAGSPRAGSPSWVGFMGPAEGTWGLRRLHKRPQLGGKDSKTKSSHKV